MSNWYKKYIKNILDIFFATITLIAVSPIMVLTISILFFTNKGKVFFFQNRPGKHTKLFKVVKFKTMTDEKDRDGILLSDDQRLTTIGKFVRSTSIDELPQLLNVIKGDMSLIGPRPLLEKYLPLYDQEQIRRHEVKPGISGWAQVNGRNTISWQEKFAYDVYYVDHISFLMDLKIFFMTIKKVLIREGINSDQQVIMEEFEGNL